MEKAFLLGTNAITKAIGQILALFDIEIKEADDFNILVMVDGEEWNQGIIEQLETTSKRDWTIIYLESKDNEPHRLLFLTEIYRTYKIRLEEFSIVKLCSTIEEIKGNKTQKDAKNYNWTKLYGDDLNNKDNLEFPKYLKDRRGYVQRYLHSKTELDKDEVERLIRFDLFFSILKVPADLSLNVLVVENNPDDKFKKSLQELKKRFTPNLKFYLRRTGFKDLKNKILTDENPQKITVEVDKDGNGLFEKTDIELKDVDLILQDIFLEEGDLSGSDLAKLYFDVAPQAIVFFLTSMDVETLAATDHVEMVDRIISKKRIIGLMSYYYERFNELYRPLLWSVFMNAKQRNGTAKLDDKTSVRNLLRNIRSWTMEPGILFHGYALPEMVDHEFRHISGLWRMANDILGPFLDKVPDGMEEEEKILLTLAIWLHDIGHRGDEYHYESMDIRENHGSISESLIIDHFDALGIGWLKEFCDFECKDKNFICGCGGQNRNKKNGCNEGAICPLRKVGLICRYHQSTAPLKEDKLAELILKRKRPSPYCIVGMKDFRTEVDEQNYKKQIDTWLDATEDFGWFSFDIRTLEEFGNYGELINLTCLFRWLDALHTHNEKVGSLTQVKSFLAYLKMRRDYCEKKFKEIKNLLDGTESGTEAYLKLINELMRRDSYRRLLDVQWIHLWRNAAVKDIKGEWFWDKEWTFRVVFELFDNDPLDSFDEIKTIKAKLDSSEKDFHKLWEKHVKEEVVNSERKSQMDESTGKPSFAKYFKDIEPSYAYYSYEDGKEQRKPIETANNETGNNKRGNGSTNGNVSTKRTKGLIIDCDPGCDDALAILLAVRCGQSPYDDIHITTVAGNVPVERTTHNARKIAGVALHDLTNGPKITVHKGSAVSYMGKAPNVTSVHGRDGLGEVPQKIYPKVVTGIEEKSEESAVDILMGKKRSNGKKYDLVCTGPLTNLATALSLSEKPEELLNKFDRIVIMGGAFDHRGNITPTAEFNFFFDPVAVQILLDAIKKDEANLSNKIVFVPLNITERVQLNIKQEKIGIAKEAGKDNPVGQWTLCMLQKYFEFHALSANELQEDCVQNKCSAHSNVSACETTGKAYADIREEIKVENMIGKSGNEKMPKFCYLHDPLAMWYAMNLDDNKLEEASIKIHTDNDEMRGTVIVFDKKDSKPYSKGVKVKYLDPGKVTTDYVKGFKDNLLEACGLMKNGVGKKVA